jgi:hypothetical protein
LSIEAATLSGAFLSILGGVNREVAKCELHRGYARDRQGRQAQDASRTKRKTIDLFN